jgi:hypothetical protein
MPRAQVPGFRVECKNQNVERGEYAEDAESNWYVAHDQPDNLVCCS